MKVLVSTELTQGKRKNDFCFVPEGELVAFGSECDGERIDGKCGCRRALIGFESNTATTTMKVVDMPLTEEQFAQKLREHLFKGGWLKVAGEEADEWIQQDSQELLRLARAFAVGTLLERRGQTFQERKVS